MSQRKRGPVLNICDGGPSRLGRVNIENWCTGKDRKSRKGSHSLPPPPPPPWVLFLLAFGLEFRDHDIPRSYYWSIPFEMKVDASGGISNVVRWPLRSRCGGARRLQEWIPFG
ncbi:hypothetical protein M0802_001257 [Mischocyttarus mexicanus]|nr:hypothetical protein M0802_001257 [Mischocyttarus mexicanus]